MNEIYPLPSRAQLLNRCAVMPLSKIWYPLKRFLRRSQLLSGGTCI